jgi:cellulose synthase/poly-beta-1,6-N-acetylglucosamine synthase-like glycosyltransferase
VNIVWQVAPTLTLIGVVALTGAQFVLLVSASIELYHARQRDRHQLWRRVLASPLAPRVSVIVPAYNEEKSIATTVRSLLALLYPNLELVVVDDGSADRTLQVLISEFELSPIHPVYQKTITTKPVRAIYRSSFESRLVVVDKENGRKADAINVGINIASGELVCTIDADTLISPDALQHLVAPFLADDRTAAIGGTVRLTNDSVIRAGRVDQQRAPRNWLAGVQAVEYTRAFLVGRVGWNLLGGNLIISGAFGVFRRELLLEVGGYEHNTIGEDMEVIARLRRRGYEVGAPVRVEFSPDPVAWTEVPESLRSLARQRNRWYRGLLDVLARHKTMLFNPRYRSAGLMGMPYYLIVEALAPMLELVGITGLAVGFATGNLGVGTLEVIAFAYMMGAVVSILALMFDECAYHSYRGPVDRLLLCWYAVTEQIFYRPMNLVWRLWGLILRFRGRLEWGDMHRAGFKVES